MRVLHLSAWERFGGAATCMQRLHRGLLALGVESKIVVLSRETDDPRVAELRPHPLLERGWERIERTSIGAVRSDLSDTWFSTARPGTAVAAHPWVAESDIINVHLADGLVASAQLRELAASGRPLVWTLHDESAYTGGCHFTAGCERWRTRCHECPQLMRDPHRLVEAVFDDKRDDVAASSLTIVAPSAWIATRAAESAILRGRARRTIAYGVDVEAYTPDRRESARAALGIRDDCFVLCCAAINLGERRKGFNELVAALERCAANAEFAAAARDEKVHVLLIGAHVERVLPLPHTNLGLLRDERLVADALAASDLSIVPSLEDNLPNVVLESLACGTPVLAFDTGGIREALEEQACELVVPRGDVVALASRIAWARANLTQIRAIRSGVRGIAERRYDLGRQASEYLTLYESLILQKSGERERMQPMASSTTSSATSHLEAVGGMLAAEACIARVEEWGATLQQTTGRIDAAAQALDAVATRLAAVESKSCELSSALARAEGELVTRAAEGSAAVEEARSEAARAATVDIELARARAELAAKASDVQVRELECQRLSNELTFLRDVIAVSPWQRAKRRLARRWPTPVNEVTSLSTPAEVPETATFRAMSTARALERIGNRGLEVATVIDIGASNGMWSEVCERRFPNARYLLVEAQQTHRAALERYCKARGNAEFVLAAAGRARGEIWFDDSDAFGGLASDQKTDAAKTRVPVTTIDYEVTSRAAPGPYLLKLDVHGYEIPILEGATQVLPQASLVVMECYTFRVAEGCLLFHEMVAWMRERGFGVCDMSEPLWRFRDACLWQFDLFFVPLNRPELNVDRWL